MKRDQPSYHIMSRFNFATRTTRQSGICLRLRVVSIREKQFTSCYGMYRLMVHMLFTWRGSRADRYVIIIIFGQVSTLKEGTTVRIREDEELVKLLNCRVGWKTEMEAVSGSNPHYAAVTGCYIEHCGCEWLKSSLCCSHLLH